MTRLKLSRWRRGDKVGVKADVLASDPDLKEVIAGQVGRVVSIDIRDVLWPIEVAFGTAPDTWFFNEDELVEAVEE